MTMRVGVLFGGCSSEKEISLESGRHIYNSLDSSKYHIIPIYVSYDLKLYEIAERLLWMNATADIEKCLETDAKRIYFEDLKNQIDFCFLGLHGKYVEDGALQGLLEILEIPYNGPRIIGAAIGMDKIFQKQLLRAAGLNYPPHIVVRKEDLSANISKIESAVEKELGYPCVVKPSREGCSTGISKVNEKSQLKAAFEEALKWDDIVMAEKFMNMMEVTCTVIGNEHPTALLPTETPFKGEFLTLEEKFLPGDAQMITPPRVPEEDVKKMQEEFVKAYRAMNLRVYTRIDGFWDTKERKLYINEPNTLPGVTPSTMVFHQAAEAGMSPGDFFDKLIELALIEHGANKKQEALI
jgi:D-alanine-D-alanine ligase